MNKKLQQMTDWLTANPGKTERDWLLEVRCTVERDRMAMDRLLDTLDKEGIKYCIGIKRENHYTKYQLAPLNAITEVVFDLMIAPSVGKNSYFINVDMPDEALGQLTWNAKKDDCIPEVAFRWLLSQWAPNFNLASLDEKQYHKLMWEDMGGLLGSIIGHRGFPDWRTDDFGDKIVARYIQDKTEVETAAKKMKDE